MIINKDDDGDEDENENDDEDEANGEKDENKIEDSYSWNAKYIPVTSCTVKIKILNLWYILNNKDSCFSSLITRLYYLSPPSVGQSIFLFFDLTASVHMV